MRARIKDTGELVDVEINLCKQPLISSGARFVFEDKKGRSFLDTELDFLGADPVLAYMQALCC